MDWPAMMRFGLGVLRMTPRDFWEMTPREFLAASEPYVGEGAAPMGRAELEALRARFPDVTREADG
ncbi:rcc01693 family protein [Albimonas pacifica]|uniref:Phage tail assembly chaperone protein, TAC n=1 Tax=Albimonas pacifica TaxID=1114924 RepID=A0A1I3GLR3_9RHOB|nr:rcc01693 family protein [Albimonas pacifica]SFI24360.1 phage conserved hypothetical protein [Albimonas pacifica]